MKVLVDTSVWIDHLRKADSRLATLLLERQVLCHPLVIGELACGGLRNRHEFLGNLKRLPLASLPKDAEVLELIEAKRLHGRGLGIVDIQLLSSALLSGAKIMSHDLAVKKAAEKLGVAVSEA